MDLRYRRGAWAAVFVAGLSLIGTGAVAAGDATALGTLTGKGTVNVSSAAGTRAVKNPSLPYQSGQRITTAPDKGSQATVSLGENRVELGKGSDAKVTGQQGDYQVDLARGSVRTRSEKGTKFEVAAKNARVRPTNSSELAHAASSPRRRLADAGG